MLVVHTCPACAGSDATPVFEYNGLVLLDYMRDTPYSRYDYRLCHTCGLVYASRRPEGEELTFLYSRFDEFLGREDKLAYSAEGVRDHLAHGWLRSEEEGTTRDDLVRKVYNKQISESVHVPIIAAKVPLRGMRILELRATTGLMLDMFRKFFGAAGVYAMPMSEHYRNVIDALNPMETAIVDFDALDIPFSGQSYTATASSDGRWTVKLAAAPANATPQILSIAGTTQRDVTDVLIGEVWMCSGQSNMQWSLGQTYTGDIEGAGARRPNLRIVSVPQVGTQELKTDFTRCKS